MAKNLNFPVLFFFSQFLYAVPAYAGNGGKDCGVPELAACPVPIDINLPPVGDMLSWDQAQMVIGFRNGFRSYPGDVFKHGIPYPLPKSLVSLAKVNYTMAGSAYNLPEYIKRNDVKGLLVIKNGRIAYEYYGSGNNTATLWTSRSVGKSVVSVLVGIAIKEGAIKSLNDKVTVYNPDLQKTAWADVTLRQLIQHTSNVAWNEDYKNPESDFSKLTQCEARENPYNCVRNLIFNLKKKQKNTADPEWSYSSAGAWLLGDILERATGMSIAKYLEEKIWKPFGMASDGVWHSYVKGKHDCGAHGFNATLEDWGRFGLFVAREGKLPNGRKLLPDNWLRESADWVKARNSVSPNYPDGIFGYQWWNGAVAETAKDVAPRTGLDKNRTLWGEGIFGQILTIDPENDIIIVQWSTWKNADPSVLEQYLEAALMFNAISNALK